MPRAPADSLHSLFHGNLFTILRIPANNSRSTFRAVSLEISCKLTPRDYGGYHLFERSDTQRCRIWPTYVPGKWIHRVGRDQDCVWPSSRPVVGLHRCAILPATQAMLLREPRFPQPFPSMINPSIQRPNSRVGASPRSFNGCSPSIPSSDSCISNCCIASPAIWSENSASSSKSSCHLLSENLSESNRKAGRTSPRTTPAHPIF